MVWKKFVVGGGGGGGGGLSRAKKRQEFFSPNLVGRQCLWWSSSHYLVLHYFEQKLELRLFFCFTFHNVSYLAPRLEGDNRVTQLKVYIYGRVDRF